MTHISTSVSAAEQAARAFAARSHGPSEVMWSVLVAISRESRSLTNAVTVIASTSLNSTTTSTWTNALRRMDHSRPGVGRHVVRLASGSCGR